MSDFIFFVLISFNSYNEHNLTVNLKREIKLYSFKEQVQELQLRRELEEEKRKAGKSKELQLTSKQEELICLQLEKE